MERMAMMKTPEQVIVVDSDATVRDLHRTFCQQTFPTAKLFPFKDVLSSSEAIQKGELTFSPGDILISDCMLIQMPLTAKDEGFSFPWQKPDVVELWKRLGYCQD